MISKIPLLSIFILSIALCISCKKNADTPLKDQTVKDSVAAITAFKLINANPQITLTSYSVEMSFPDTVADVSNRVASFTLSPGATATVNGVEQISGITKNNFDSPLTYVVTNASGYSKHWIVTTSNNNYTDNWGLGYFLQQSFTNERSYSWYVNQANTGAFSNINCAPSCATMAAKWADSTFSRTAQQARDYYPQNTSLWGLSTMYNYLADFNIKSHNLFLGSTELATKDSIKKQLDQGNIVILGLQIGFIRTYSGISKNPRCDRYYPTAGAGHAILAYGYKEVDNEFYFQVMDPLGLNYTNEDGTSKGVNRYYRAEDIYGACIAHDNIALIVYHK
ncbi:MAG: C39 family peptidase [Ferruginibacter sp.]